MKGPTIDDETKSLNKSVNNNGDNVDNVDNADNGDNGDKKLNTYQKMALLLLFFLSFIMKDWYLRHQKCMHLWSFLIKQDYAPMLLYACIVFYQLLNTF